ncbi:MAG: hypothetical protein QME57_02745 [Patescibacteria group bacterium]|nr:hypothetical protein [Patescibacteria group bacterium]
MSIIKTIQDALSDSLSFSELISFIISPKFTGWLLVLKIVFIFFSLIFLGFIIIASIKTTFLKELIIWNLKEFLTYRPFGLRKVEKEWQKIKRRLETEIESEWKLAVIEADKIMDNILNQKGFKKVSLDEKLDSLTPDSLSNIEEVKKAHKIRNNIIHDPNYRLSLEETKKVIAIYEKALIDLQVL